MTGAGCSADSINAWLASRWANQGGVRCGPHVLAIPGTGNPDHLVANVAAGALRLSEDELARLESIHQ
jgi:aryl-alcohol dehydrogenase-like predicted oxidoreductase